jgi:fumarate reductase flavoprotein subunit
MAAVSDREIDVIVVGSGGAGLIAALAAQEQGARVVVAESEGVVGGASRLSGGTIMAADSSVQRAAGLHDDPEGLYEEYLLANQYGIKPGIARRVAFESGEGIEWLIALGVNFFPAIMQGGGERVPRCHVPLAELGGQHLIDVLHQRCRERGIEIALGNRVDRLLTDGNAVVGVAIGGDEFEAGAVVLATGGFGANAELIAKHLPSLAQHGDRVFYIGPDSSRGDGLALAEQVGGHLVGDGLYLSLLTPQLATNETEAYLPGWLLVVDPDGRRVFDEAGPYAQIAGVAREAGGVVYGVFDAQTLADNGSPDLPTFKLEFPPGSPMPTSIYSTEGLMRLLDAGALVRADTLEELASRLGLEADALAGAVARYNESVALGEDRDYRKPVKFLRPVAEPPFYGMEIRPAALGLTAYGVEIDEDGRVLGPRSAAVSGLYAAGECTGGVVGTRQLGSGNMWAGCLVFGRRAGRAAAALALG